MVKKKFLKQAEVKKLEKELFSKKTSAKRMREIREILQNYGRK
jgi:hypothetical protein